VPFVYKNAVHRALKLRHETHGKAKLANFIAPPLDEELGLGRSSDATPLSRCLILPIQVRGKFVAGLVVCADNAKRLDTNSARVLGEVARHVAQRLAELEVTGHRKTPKTTPNETRPVLSIVPAVTPNPSERPTVRLGGQGRAQYVDVVIPASAQLKGDLGNLASVKINEDPLLIAARDLVHELSTQVSVIVAYSDTNFLAHRTAEGHKEDAATIWNAGKQAAAIVRKLQKTLRG
jgi:hypothetical protein